MIHDAQCHWAFDLTSLTHERESKHERSSVIGMLSSPLSFRITSSCRGAQSLHLRNTVMKEQVDSTVLHRGDIPHELYMRMSLATQESVGMTDLFV